MKMNSAVRQAELGQTIIEVVIAVGIVALVMTAVVSIITTSVKNSAQSQAASTATKYTQDGMEFLRSQRDLLGWESFVAVIQTDAGAPGTVTYCLPSPLPATTTAFSNLSGGACTTGSGQYADPPNNLFQRSADLAIKTVAGATYIDVTVKTTWYDGSTLRTVNSSEEFHQDVN